MFNPPSNAHLENRNVYLPLCRSSSPQLATSPAVTFSLAEPWSAGSAGLGELEGAQQGKGEGSPEQGHQHRGPALEPPLG